MDLDGERRHLVIEQGWFSPQVRSRRSLLRGALASLGAQLGLGCELGDQPSARRITRGPAHHWFGYYDKLAFEPSERYVLGMQVGFEGRPPRVDDAVRVGMVDTHDGDRWVDLGQSRAWNWQQGCMLQWIPGSDGQIVWNDRQGHELVARVLDIGGQSHAGTVDRPICCLSPDGKTAFSIDFERLATVRSGYGYATPTLGRRVAEVPDDNGIWRIDLLTGVSELILSIAAVNRFGPPRETWSETVRHWVYQVAVSPDASRVAFLHCAARRDGLFASRLLTASARGQDVHEINPGGRVSHFCWRDAESVLAWATVPGVGTGYHVFQDRRGTSERVGEGVMVENGHCTYLADPRWILCDTYPSILSCQVPYLFDTTAERKHPLGTFFAPPWYRGPDRCDLHPRASPSGRMVALDSAHEGGRQMYVIDVSSIIGAAG